MIWLILILALFVVMFAGVLLVGAPFLPTLRRQTEEAIGLLDLKPGQSLLDLGSGDGRVLKLAAQHGIQARGYEINPLLVLVSMFHCLKERQHVTVRWSNFWTTPIGEADAIYVFLLKRYMTKLDNKITHEITKPTKVISFAFAFPDRTPIKTKNGLMLYEFKPEAKSSGNPLRHQ
ncbi:MAG TPA: hypothetical protein VMR28_01305 [Candidatus Saccharimonadales bacterium]|nr:hypothetical protein [Candidatus Saccharimonadales bacterium]